MTDSNKQIIKNTVRRSLSSGLNTSEVLEEFLTLKMNFDLGDDRRADKGQLTMNDIMMNLLGNGIIDDKDIKIEKGTGAFPVPCLVVKLSPFCNICIKSSRSVLRASVNDNIHFDIYINHFRAEDLAKWIIRQKQKLNEYMQEWEEVLKTTTKKLKSANLAKLAIKAIFVNAMIPYPDLEYSFIEQQRRMRIRVKLPNCNLGLFIDAWWGSYKQKLPQQIEDLKALMEVHSKTQIKSFFTASR